MAGLQNNPDWHDGQQNKAGDAQAGNGEAQTARESLSQAAFNPKDAMHSSSKMAERYALSQAEARSYNSEPEKTAEVGQLAGRPAGTSIGSGLETNALLHALNHDPTPEGLGKEGCMASISHYVLEPYMREHNKQLPHFVDSHAFLAYVKDHPEIAKVSSRSQKDLKAADLQPGDIVIGDKSTGNHVMVATRVPENWGYPQGALMLCGNTGLPMPDGPPYPHFRAAQEVIGEGTDRYNYHHGQLNSQRASNPYLGATFRIVRFADSK